MQGKKTKAYNIIYFLALVLYFALAFYLFYSQLTVYPVDVQHRFESDTYVHVRFAVEDGYFYSLSSFIYYILSKLPAGMIVISAFLSIATVMSIPLTGILISKIPEAGKMPPVIRDILSFCANFVMGFYLPFVNRQHYIGYQNANMWHNSTYILMKCAALSAMLFFIDAFKERKDRIGLKNWLLYTCFLAVATGFKASFFTVFAPCLAIVLLYGFIKKEVSFKNAFILAVSVVPSFIVMAVESLVLFDDSGSGIVIAPFKTFFERGDHPKVSLVTSVFFILIVIVLSVKTIFRDRYYVYGLLMFAVGFVESLLLAEDGARGRDANFLWGYSIALFFMFILSAVKLWQCFKQKEIKALFAGCAMLVYLWHVFSGVWHFVLLLQGFTYFA